eukprot:gene11072-7703_t
MGRYVPPHRRAGLVESEGPATAEVDPSGLSVADQQEAWRALSRSIVSIFNRLTTTNAEDAAVELLRENIVRGRGLVAAEAIRAQQLNPELTPTLVAVLAQVNRSCPLVVQLLCHRLAVEWPQAYRRKDFQRVENINTFLAWLYIFHVTNKDVVMEILVTLLTSERRTDEDVDLASKLFSIAFKALAQRDSRVFHTVVLQAFRDLLAMDDDASRLSPRAQAALSRCLQEVRTWEKKKDEESLIPEHLAQWDLEEQACHELELGKEYPTERHLDRFQVDPNYEENEKKYESIRRAVLGEQWEMELLEAHMAEEEAEEEGEEQAESQQPAEGGGAAMDRSMGLADQTERRVRQEVYLAMRSSVRADEVVHKLLKSLEPSTERIICFMVIEGCCEERAYKRIYEMVAERLCKSKRVFQGYFIEAFHERYAAASTLTVKQITYTCSLFAHLLRTEALYWGRCLCALNIVHNDESQRIFIQKLFAALAEGMGMPALVARIEGDPEVITQTSWLFPLQDEDDKVLEQAINLYVAMDLAPLGGRMRAELEKRRMGRKRTRDD